MAPYEALYGRRYRSPVAWCESGKARLLGTDLVQDALDKVKLIQDQFRTVQSRHKSYSDRKVRYVAYMVGEMKYVDDLCHVLDFSMVQLDGDFILGRQIRKLWSKDIALVKVQWRGQPVEEATWETEREMQSRYPHLFETPGNFLDPFEDKRLFKRGRM
ncbi:uncharacterized protein [Nicotiana tomentosiformis]|uniref:uncharacterized protein n=1 Tax=Nicotiana tomentosiformis TaxID=4098 RepID=UPI00388C7019